MYSLENHFLNQNILLQKILMRYQTRSKPLKESLPCYLCMADKKYLKSTYVKRINPLTQRFRSWIFSVIPCVKLGHVMKSNRKLLFFFFYLKVFFTNIPKKEYLEAKGSLLSMQKNFKHATMFHNFQPTQHFDKNKVFISWMFFMTNLTNFCNILRLNLI